VSPQGRTTTTTLDGTGHVTQEQVGTVALGRLTPVVYDQTGQRLRSITQGARSTQFTYLIGAGQADAGYLWHIQDGVSTTELRHDVRGRLLSAESAWGTAITSKPSFTWFKNDVLKTVRTPELSVDHTFSYNAVKEIQQYLPPSVATVPLPATNYTYTTDRDQFTEQRSDQLWGSKTITQTYISSTGQLDTIVLPGTSLSSLAGIIDYDYFTTSNTSGAAAGRISKITGPTATNNVQYLYNGPLRTSLSWAGDVAGQVSWTYNNRFWPNKETLVAGGTFDRFIDYDKDGLIVCNSSVTCLPADSTALTIGHSMVHGRVNSIIQGTATETWTYSDTSADYSATPTSRAFGELREQAVTVSGTTVADIVYDAAGGAVSERRDALGRIRFKTETFRDATAPHANQTNKWEYIYDERGQLKSTKNNTFPVFDATYDKNGNVKTVSVNGGASMNCSVDAQDRLTSCGGLTLSYYDNGEVKSKTNAAGVWTYHYDALGRLRVVATPGGTQIEYVLDGEGRRIAKKVAGVIQRKWLYHDSLSPVAEFDGSGALLARYVYGSRKNIPDLVIKGSTVYRLISDQLGSPRYAVNVANKDDVQYQLTYGPFGTPIVAGGLATTTIGWIPFGFAGGIYDPETGLLHFGAREYDPEIGRWMSKDPVRFESGDTPNLYLYVNGDPVNQVDARGTAAQGVDGGAANGMSMPDPDPAGGCSPKNPKCAGASAACANGCYKRNPPEVDGDAFDECIKCCDDMAAACEGGSKPYNFGKCR
jgi:RHS repeat-associated protein